MQAFEYYSLIGSEVLTKFFLLFFLQLTKKNKSINLKKTL